MSSTCIVNMCALNICFINMCCFNMCSLNICFFKMCHINICLLLMCSLSIYILTYEFQYVFFSICVASICKLSSTCSTICFTMCFLIMCFLNMCYFNITKIRKCHFQIQFEKFVNKTKQNTLFKFDLEITPSKSDLKNDDARRMHIRMFYNVFS